MEPMLPIYPRDRQSWERLLIRHARGAGFACDAPDGLVRTLLTLYAEMLADVCERLNRMPENHLRHLLNQTQIKRLPARAAKTTVSFEIAEEQTAPVPVTQGTLLCVSGAEDTVLFRVRESFDAHALALTCVGWADASADTGMLCVKDGIGMPFTAFGRASAPLHRLEMWFSHVFCGCACRRAVRLSVRARLDERPVLLTDAQRFAWTLHTESGDAERVAVVPEVQTIPDGILLVFEGFVCTQSACLTLEAREAGLCGLVLEIEGARADACPILPLQVLRDGEQCALDRFYPFGSPPQPYSECFVYGEDACGLFGSELTISYAVALEKTEEALPEVPESVDFRWVMRKPLSKPETPPVEVYVRDAQWSYWNGDAWCALPVEIPYCFNLEQAQVTLSFICPDDLVPGGPEGGDGLLLRLSWTWDDALFAVPRRVFTPRLRGLTLSRRVSAIQLPTRVLSDSYGIQSVLDEAHAMRPFTPPPCAGRALFLGFDRMPAQAQLRLLVVPDGCATESGHVLTAYMADDAAEVPCDMHDETRGLTRAGILRLMTSAHPVQTTLFGETCYWVRLEVPGTGEMLPITGIYPNACKVENRVRHTLDVEAAQLSPDGQIALDGNIVQAWVFCHARKNGSGAVTQERWHAYDPLEGAFVCGAYRLDTGQGLLTLAPFAQTPYGDAQALYHIVYDTSDGEEGNFAAGAVDRLYEEIPLIAEIHSPLPAVGGRAAETDDALYDRITCLLHAGGRAVSREDYARLAYACCPLVERARCVCKNGLRLEFLTREGEFPQAHDALVKLFRELGVHTLYDLPLSIHPMEGMPRDISRHDCSPYEALQTEGMMRLENLDNATYEQLFASAVARIPSLTTQWTDYNPADTGIMLLETLSGLTEQLGYMLNLTDDVLLSQMLCLVYGAGVQSGMARDYAQRFARDCAQVTRAATPADLEQIALASPFGLERVYTRPTQRGIRLLVYRAHCPLTPQEETELTAYLRFRCPMGVRPLVEQIPCAALSVTVRVRIDRRRVRVEQMRDCLTDLIAHFLAQKAPEAPLDLAALRVLMREQTGVLEADVPEAHPIQDTNTGLGMTVGESWSGAVLHAKAVQIIFS